MSSGPTDINTITTAPFANPWCVACGGAHKAAAWREVLLKVKKKKWPDTKWGDRYRALRLALTRAVCVGESNVLATSRAHVSAISSEDNWESEQ